MTKRTPAKQIKKPIKQKKAASSRRYWIDTANSYLDLQKIKVAGFLFGLSLVLSLIYYLQARDSPIMTIHKWENSDMAFFDKWARHIVAGDWWGDEILHPYHDWHDDLADE